MVKINVVGIGFRPLDDRASDAVIGAEVILSSERLLEVFRTYREFDRVREKIKVLDSVDETMAFIREGIAARAEAGMNSIALLAAGDPMFFGIGRRVVEELGSDMVEIFPDLSSVQVAFSRIKEPWDNVFLMSMHGGPDSSKRRKLEFELKHIPKLIITHRRLAILTDRENTPAVIAQSILAAARMPYLRPSALRFHVCERLGYPDERIVAGSAREIASMTFVRPNVLIILRTAI